MDYEFLSENGKKVATTHMNKTIGETKELLIAKLMGIEETGPTAMGPAALTSIAMAAEGAAGSTVVICTDGLSNVGLGAYDECKNEADMAAVDEFYEKVGQFAQTHGVTINIVSIEGDECNLDSLAKLAELTGGTVERVSPTSLTQNFANMMSKPVIATNVVVKVKIHKALEFRNEAEANLNEDKTLMARQLGNVTEDNKFCFEYHLRPLDELVEMDDIDLIKLKSVPFQTQITYKGLDGAKYLRVITQLKEVSHNREENEKKADHSIMAQNCIQQSSKMAREGNFRQAQSHAKIWGRQMKANIKSEEEVANYKQFNNAWGGAYNMMAQKHVEEECEEGFDSDEYGQGGGGGC